jgi:CheY-like chemotaxis protein
VEIDCEPGAPKVEADIGQIQQLVMNLLINAAEAIGTAQPGRIGIRIGGRRVIDAEHAVAVLGDRDLEPGWYAYVEVTDTGCGMDEETVSKIFDPFFTTKFTGRGLGLAAVQGIVRGNKGAIRVTSEPGKGATFAIYLPAVDFYGVEKSAACPGTDIILVADDEEVVCRIAEASLRRGGYEAHTVREGKAAASFFRQNASRVRLVLLDMSMPGMSGREILLDIRHARSEVPVIVTSGYSEAEVALEFEGLDIAGFLQKPFTAGEIVAKVEEVLNARRGSGSGDSRVV